MADKTIYELRDVSYSYLGRFPALEKISMSIREGEHIALLGANGSGKSTLLMVLAGLAFPDKGTVKFYGEELKEGSFQDPLFQVRFRSTVGIVFQNSDIQLFNSNVEDEISFGLSQLDIPKDEAATRVARYMSLMDIEYLKDRHPQYMSMGEKKRVAIASVLAMEPKVVLLDEPTAGLDPRTSRHLVEMIVELESKGCTVIISTQDIHLVPEVADRAVILGENKEIVKDEDICYALADREFLERHNLVHVHTHRHGDKTHAHAHEHPGHDHPHSE
jgi:cobalt/nickel transport system ATP-binding protein